MRYDPAVFSVRSVEQAKRIILTPEGSVPTSARWAVETAAHVARLVERWRPGPRTRVLDYGCGIGRISRELASRGCRVTGMDLSPDMRRLFAEYVSPFPCRCLSPSELAEVPDGSFDCALAFFVLQHCEHPEDDIAELRRCLVPGGSLAVLNNASSRAVPVSDGRRRMWRDDGRNVWSLLEKAGFSAESSERAPLALRRGAAFRLEFLRSPSA